MEPQFKADLSAVFRRAALERVSGLLSLGCGVSESLLSDEMCRDSYRETISQELALQGIVADRVPKIYGSQGVHPHDSNQTTDEVMVRFLNTIHDNPRIVIVGETGLDYFYMRQPREIQMRSLRRHMVLAEETGLPVSIHCRDSAPDAMDASRDILTILAEFPRVRCVMHCFSQDQEFADRVLGMSDGQGRRDHMISFSGVITYPKNEVLRQVASRLPADRLLIETDAPYLAPQRNRGQRNEPMFLSETARYLAQIRATTFDAVAELTTANAKRFLGISD